MDKSIIEVFRGEAILSEIVAFAQNLAKPLVGEFSEEWIGPVFGDSKPAIILF